MFELIDTATARKWFGRRTGVTGPRGMDPGVPGWSAARFGMRSAFGSASIPTVDNSYSWLRGAPNYLGMMLNGPTPGNPNAPQLGDCTIAATGHIRQSWAFNTGGQLWSPTDDNIEDAYCQACGYVKGDPSTDAGGNLQTVLKNWMDPGLPGNAAGNPVDVLLGFFELDPRNLDDVHEAIAWCGGLYCAGALPESWMSWSPGQVWDVAEEGTEGHCISFFGSDKGVRKTCVSWGFEIDVTDDAFAYYITECYAPISLDWVMKTGVTPFKAPLPMIEAQFTKIAAAPPQLAA
jgi:hypothetical protein